MSHFNLQLKIRYEKKVDGLTKIYGRNFSRLVGWPESRPERVPTDTAHHKPTRRRVTEGRDDSGSDHHRDPTCTVIREQVDTGKRRTLFYNTNLSRQTGRKRLLKNLKHRNDNVTVFKTKGESSLTT